MEDKDTVKAWSEIKDILRLTATHYGLWFAETERLLGIEAAIACEAEAGRRFVAISGRRLGKTLCANEEAITAEIALDAPQGELDGLADSLAVNWLAADGVWFQAVENAAGMTDAKRVNDACWSKFARLEARRVLDRLGAPAGGGLDALESALAGRMYARINEWKLVRESETALVFTMLRCRVQDARTRKGLPEYPCKSGGVTEYTSFANEVDSRIETTCLGCPPDEREEGFACSWRFMLETDFGAGSRP